MIIEVDNTDAFLEHYGVKGMRWGIRKKGGTGSSGAKRIPRKHKNKKYGRTSSGREKRFRTDDSGNKRSGFEKLAIVGAGVVTQQVTASITTAATRNIGVGAIVGTAAGIKGAAFTRKQLDMPARRKSIAEG